MTAKKLPEKSQTRPEAPIVSRREDGVVRVQFDFPDDMPEAQRRMFESYRPIPLDRLQDADWQYKGEDEAMQGHLQASLDRYGQYQNLVVRRVDDPDSPSWDGPLWEVIDGHHRKKQLIGEGMRYGMAFDAGFASRTDAQLMGTAVNEIRFPSEILQQAKLMAELMESAGRMTLLQMLPVTNDELERMQRMLTWSFDELEGGEHKGRGRLQRKTDTRGQFVLTRKVHKQWERAEKVLLEQLEREDQTPEREKAYRNGQVIEMLLRSFFRAGDGDGDGS